MVLEILPNFYQLKDAKIVKTAGIRVKLFGPTSQCDPNLLVQFYFKIPR